MKNVPVVRVVERDEASDLPEPSEELRVALSEVAGAAREGLLAMSVLVGLRVIAEMMDAEVIARVGPKYAKIPGRTAKRHASAPGSVVLCVDEQSQIQALDRTAPVLPLRPGIPERRTHDDVRNGTTNLYAALDVASGNVIADLSARHRALEFRKFLNLINRSVPAELDVHVIVDNSSTHKTPEIHRWLLRHPRFELHFTPTYSSWLNLVERWFGELTAKWLRRGTHRSTRELEHAISTWIATWNQNPNPFVWHKTADEILDTLARYCQRISDSGH